MKRRPKGSGSILRTPEGTFRALFAFTTGRREDIDGSPFATYAEAEAALDGILAELRDAGAVRGGLTLRRLGARVLDRREKEGYRSASTDRNRWRAYVETWDLVDLPARTITRGDVRDWLAGLAAKGLATQTRRNALNMLRAVFAGGVDDELLDENPCTAIKVKHRGETADTSTYLTPTEALALALASSTDLAVTLAITTGMRSGELRSLRWEDVRLDVDAPHVVVRYGSPEEPTKNGKVRSVRVGGVALDALRKAKVSYDAQIDDDDITSKHGIVLPSFSRWYRQKGRVVEPELWASWRKAAGIKRRLRFHDLRHTCATLLLTGAFGRRWSYEEVKDLLGHSSVKVTERYARSVGTLAERAANEMFGAPDRIGTGSATSSREVTQAREILQRRGSDSNRRMTVLQTVA